MRAPVLPRRGFLRGLGLVTLPLIGGGVTLIGKIAAPVPLVDVAAAPILADPRERARYAWEAFSAAMREITADAHGWHVQGGEIRPFSSKLRGGSGCRPQRVFYVPDAEPRCPGLVVDQYRDFDLEAVQRERPSTPRRGVLRGLASLPLISGGTLLTVDPVFAAIAAHAEAEQAFVASIYEEADNAALSERAGELLDALLATPPQTMAGLRALVEHAHACVWHDPNDADEAAASWFLSTIAEACDRLLPA